MHMPFVFKPISFSVSVPPLYRWPLLLKRAVLGVAVTTCVAVYALLLAGMVGVALLAVNLVVK